MNLDLIKERAIEDDAEAQFQYGAMLIQSESEDHDEIIYWLTKMVIKGFFGLS